MGYRIDSIAVKMDIYVEFEGRHDCSFTFAPDSIDDPIAVALLAKWREIIERQVTASGTDKAEIFR